MKLDLSKIEFSSHDKKKNITIPTKLTTELAEDVGFHIGDGYMKHRTDQGKYEFHYSGGRDDIKYFKNVLIPRKTKLFGKRDRFIEFSKKSNEIIFRFDSKAVLMFYRDVLNVAQSPKTCISVPNWIFYLKE